MDNVNLQQLLALGKDESFEVSLQSAGYSLICGVDEAGRGPLAGPVVAAAVIYRQTKAIMAAEDSKKLTKLQRERLFTQITDELEFGIGQCSPAEIEELNIRGASLEAMRRAVESLSRKPEILLVDGRDKVPIDIISLPIIKGDSRVATIGAASVAAKVTRDRIMSEYDSEYPEYGFARHFGYPTLMHREAIRKYGPCPIHRKSFRGVREFV